MSKAQHMANLVRRNCDKVVKAFTFPRTPFLSHVKMCLPSGREESYIEYRWLSCTMSGQTMSKFASWTVEGPRPTAFVIAFPEADIQVDIGSLLSLLLALALLKSKPGCSRPNA